MRIGILGGTFNPIHNGHLKIAELAYKRLKLDKIIFIPAYSPPHKKESDIIDAALRFEMVKRATKDYPYFEVSDIEINRKEISYSIKTLKLLKEQFGTEAELYFIAGADSVSELSTWKNIDEVLKISRFFIVNRPGFSLDNIPKEAHILEIDGIEISSSDIRKRIKQGQSIDHLLNKDVIEYIRLKKIYT